MIEWGYKLEKGDFSMKKLFLSVVAMVAIFTLAACGNSKDDSKNASDENGAQQPQQEEVDISDDELVDENEVVALVNDNEILGDKYNFIYAQLKTQYAQMGMDAKDDEVQETTIDKVIEEELLAQEAKSKDIQVKESDVDAHIKEIKEESEENYQNVLEQFDMTEAEFKNRLLFEMTMEKYQDEQLEVKVSDQEIEEAYDDLKKENEDMPELDEVKSELKQQLQDQKVNEQLEKIVEEAKENAEIDKKLKV